MDALSPDLLSLFSASVTVCLKLQFSSLLRLAVFHSFFLCQYAFFQSPVSSPLKYNHCTRSHLHGSFIDLAIFPIKSVTGQISGIHHFLPLHPLWQIGKSNIPGFPVKIIACIKEIILTSVGSFAYAPHSITPIMRLVFSMLQNHARSP